MALEPSSKPKKNARVFIVEDDLSIGMHIEFMLKSQGYSVVGTATNSDSAIKEIRNSNPDIILMDVSIEGEIDGIDTAYIIKDEFNIPVVFITSFFDEETIARAKIATPFGYLIKPVSPKDLFIAIDISLYNHSIERLLKENEEWFITSLRSITDGIITVDKDEKVKFINSTAEKLLGISDSIIGEVLSNIYNPIREYNQVFQPSIKYQFLTEQRDYIYISKPDGSKIFLEETISPIQDSNTGISLGKIIVFKDITKKLFLEHKLVIRLSYEIGVSNFSKVLLSPFTNIQNLNSSLKDLLSFIDISRITYFNYSEIGNKVKFSIVESVGINEKIPNLNEYGEEFKKCIYDSIEVLKENNQVFGNVTHCSNDFKSIMEERNIKSFILVPIFYQRNLDGFLFFEDVIQIRDWPEEDLQIFRIL